MVELLLEKKFLPLLLLLLLHHHGSHGVPAIGIGAGTPKSFLESEQHPFPNGTVQLKFNLTQNHINNSILNFKTNIKSNYERNSHPKYESSTLSSIEPLLYIPSSSETLTDLNLTKTNSPKNLTMQGQQQRKSISITSAGTFRTIKGHSGAHIYNIHRILLTKPNPQQGINSIWSGLLPNPEVLRKLVKMKETLEPKMKFYLTKKYNSFLSTLIPVSQRIGVPAAILNSLKIPQNLDPRSVGNETVPSPSLSSSSTFLHEFLRGVQDGFHRIRPSNGPKRSFPNYVEFLTGLRSDQELDAIYNGRKRYGSSPKDKVIYEPRGTRQVEEGEHTGESQSTLVPPGSGGKQEYLTGSTILKDPNQRRLFEDNLRTIEFEDPHPGSTLKQSSRILHLHGGPRTYGLTGYLEPFSILGGLAFLMYLGVLVKQSAGTALVGPISRKSRNGISKRGIDSLFDQTNQKFGTSPFVNDEVQNERVMMDDDTGATRRRSFSFIDESPRGRLKRLLLPQIQGKNIIFGFLRKLFLRDSSPPKGHFLQGMFKQFFNFGPSNCKIEYECD